MRSDLPSKRMPGSAGMVMCLFMFNLIPVLYSLYGKRTPPEGSGGMAH